MGVEIPDKLYFRIGEVSRPTRTPQYVLRFWETQFPQLKVRKSSTGHRMFRRREVEIVLEIKDLLYKQGFTIEGARQTLQGEAKAPKSARLPKRVQAELFSDDPLPEIRRELQDILQLLK